MVTLTVCATCRAPDRTVGGGAALLDAVRASAPAGIAVAGHDCLWSCASGASVQLSGPGRTTYVMGHFAVADAGAIVDFARAYAATSDGVVPFDRWPKGVLGHFIARVPA